MSLPWRSELTLRLSRRHCQAWLAEAWTRRVHSHVEADGLPAESIPAALDALQQAPGARLPRRARLLVADELAYLRLRPARSGWPEAQRDAREHFENILDAADCKVQVARAPMGPWWLAAAVLGADFDEWNAAAGSHGVAFDRVEPALLEDLRLLAPRIGKRENSVLALLRDEGVSLVRIAAGLPVELSWERCDPNAPRDIEQRLLAFQKPAMSSQADPLAIVCRNEEQARVWRAQAQAYGWTLMEQALRALAPPPARQAA